MSDDDRGHPLLLRADNFTPPQRTPWGGTRVLRELKASAPLAQEKAAYTCAGESWELSVEPDFPSFVDAAARPGVQPRTLASVIAEDPHAFLGREARRGQRGTALLVKLIDTADELSVQIHPTDDYAGLAPGEAGKPESWYIVSREPGAGLYLGLADGVTRDALASALADGADLSPLLGFVPVEPGDFFLIEAGTPHAIGRGIVLVEPQHVAPGKRGLTYRYWDWNRRYDARGVLDPRGEPRALHVEHALAVTRWDAPRGAAFAESVRLRAGEPDLGAAASLTRLAGPRGGLPSAWLDVARLAGTGELAWPAADALVGLTVVAGSVTVIEAHGRRTRVERGRSAVLPACLGDVRLSLDAAHAVLSSIP
jgi:mannose-6-phosphate isomerase